MKKLLVYIIFLLPFSTFSQNIGIGTADFTPNASSVLELKSNALGLLIPTVTAAERAAMTPLAEAAQGLMVYQSDGVEGFYVNTSTTTTTDWEFFMTSTGNSWTEEGNSGTTPGTHFIGTTDAQDFVIKANNTEWVRIESDGKVGIGESAPAVELEVNGTFKLSGDIQMNNVTTFHNTGTDNIMMAKNAGSSNSGSGNVLAGYYAGQNNTGDNNVYLGREAGRNATGDGNVAIGWRSANTSTTNSNVLINSLGAKVTSGYGNTLIGSTPYSTATTTGSRNTAFNSYDVSTTYSDNTLFEFGTRSLADRNTVLGGEGGTGSDNTSIFGMALNSSGAYNVCIGDRSSWSNTDGQSNIIMGYNAGYSKTAGDSCIIIGRDAGNNANTKNGNVFLGNSAGQSETGRNKLYITPGTSGLLIYGEFENDLLRVAAEYFVLNTNTASPSLLIKADASQTANLTEWQNSAATVLAAVDKDGDFSIGDGTANSDLDIAGSFGATLVTKTAAYTATATDHTIIADASGGAFTVTLPTASGIAGRQYVIKKIDASNNVTVQADGSENIDAANTKVLSAQWEVIKIQSDGTDWSIIN